MLADCLRDLGVGVVSLCGRCPCLSGDSLTRGPGARTYNGQGLPRRSLSNSYAQVKGDIGTSGQAVCKTVGLAYVGSNPTPATTCENGPWPGHTRARGPPCCSPTVCHDVPL